MPSKVHTRKFSSIMLFLQHLQRKHSPLLFNFGGGNPFYNAITVKNLKIMMRFLLGYEKAKIFIAN